MIDRILSKGIQDTFNINPLLAIIASRGANDKLRKCVDSNPICVARRTLEGLRIRKSIAAWYTGNKVLAEAVLRTPVCRGH